MWAQRSQPEQRDSSPAAARGTILAHWRAPFWALMRRRPGDATPRSELLGNSAQSSRAPL